MVDAADTKRQIYKLRREWYTTLVEIADTEKWKGGSLRSAEHRRRVEEFHEKTKETFEILVGFRIPRRGLPLAFAAALDGYRSPSRSRSRSGSRSPSRWQHPEEHGQDFEAA